jgi:hypothetical protein
VRQAGCRILESHRPRQPESFLRGDIGAMRTPPIAGPQATLSIATTALISMDDR